MFTLNFVFYLVWCLGSGSALGYFAGRKGWRFPVALLSFAVLGVVNMAVWFAIKAG